MRKIPQNLHRFRALILPLTGLALVTAGFTAPGRQSLFVDLAVGQSVTLDQVAGHWQIGIPQLNHPVDQGYTVAEIDADSILFDEVTGLRLPQAITHTYEVRIRLAGTVSKVRVQARDGGHAKKLVQAQYGPKVTVLSAKRID